MKNKRRLLTKHYNKIVFTTFEMSESDFFNYYTNVIDKHYRYNTDIIEKLTSEINHWIDWYKSKIHSNNLYLHDGEGNEKELDLYKTMVPLFPEFNIRRHVNKTFFDSQQRVVEVLAGNIHLKNKVLESEDLLPEPLKQLFKDNPSPDGFDFEDIKNRQDLLGRVYETLKTEVANIKSLMIDTKQDLESKPSVPVYAMALIIKNITINKKGVGVNDGVDYTKKFKIKSENTLYNNFIDLTKDKVLQESYREKASELIKKKGL